MVSIYLLVDKHSFNSDKCTFNKIQLVISSSNRNVTRGSASWFDNFVIESGQKKKHKKKQKESAKSITGIIRLFCKLNSSLLIYSNFPHELSSFETFSQKEWNMTWLQLWTNFLEPIWWILAKIKAVLEVFSVLKKNNRYLEIQLKEFRKHDKTEFRRSTDKLGWIRLQTTCAAPQSNCGCWAVFEGREPETSCDETRMQRLGGATQAWPKRQHNCG